VIQSVSQCKTLHWIHMKDIKIKQCSSAWWVHFAFQKLNLGWNLDRIAPNLPRATWKICLPMTQLRYIACLYSSMQNRHKQCSIIGWVHIASWSQPWAARLHATIGMKHIPVVAENKHCSIFHWSGIENFEKLISIRNWIVRPPH
jgi:hypothetical protein